MQPVRVDEGCYLKLIEKSKPISSILEIPKSSRTLYQGSLGHQARDPRADISFDADLKKALEMSLEETKGISGAKYDPQSQIQLQPKPMDANWSAKKPRVKDDDEDAELKAAIEASLKDMEEQKKQHATALKQQNYNASGSGYTAPKKDYELSLMEAENINLFSTLVDRLQHQASGTILREPQIQELYESIGALRPKLARTYGETMSKHGKCARRRVGNRVTLTAADTLLDLHSKLSTVVRYYDRMLEERLTSTYSQRPYAAYGPPSSVQRPVSSIYPSIIPSAVSTGYEAGVVESFYTGNAAPVYSDPYARSQTLYANQHLTQSPYLQHTPRAPAAPGVYGGEQYQQAAFPNHTTQQRQRQNSASSHTSNRAPSLKYRQPSSEYILSTPSRQSSLHYPQLHSQMQPNQFPPSHVPLSESSIFYHNTDGYASSPQQQHHSTEQRPDGEYPLPPQQQQYQQFAEPTQVPPQQPNYRQPSQQQQMPSPVQHHQPQQTLSQQVPYPEQTQFQAVQQTAQLTYIQQPHQAPRSMYTSQTAFPSAPTHQPQMPVQQRIIEESLIEL